VGAETLPLRHWLGTAPPVDHYERSRNQPDVLDSLPGYPIVPLQFGNCSLSIWHLAPQPCAERGPRGHSQGRRCRGGTGSDRCNTKTEGMDAHVPDEIHFYRANEKPYGAFSNLHRRTVYFEDQTYTTAEHAYQAGKARKTAVREWILSAPTPSLVAMAAHGLYTWDVSPNWAKLKFERMREVLLAKFTQHADLRELLLSTGNARLVEAARTDTPVNRTWGEVNGKGRNMLGVLLMEVREELRSTVVE
jgi:ribA/ribD-fused uncharacterized protein